MKLSRGRFYIWKETFAVVKSQKPCLEAFANIVDKNEITVVIEQNKCNQVIEMEGGWKILTFDGVLPFNQVGFIAEITQALAEERIPVFVISSYSTDHFLVKKEHLEIAKKKLESLGFAVDTE